MKKHIVFGGFAAVFAATVFSGTVVRGQAGTGGMRFVYVLRMEQKLATDKQADQMATMAVESFRKAVLPEGTAEMEIVTDGQSVRSELHAPMAKLPKGSVVIFPAGQTDGYVLNPGDKTYFVLKAPQAPPLPPGVSLPKPQVSVKPSGTFDTIAGIKAEKVDMTWRMPIPVAQGAAVPPGMPKEISVEFENWCSSMVKMPAAVLRLMGGAEMSMPGFGLEELTKGCPFALRSRLRMSAMPGVELVSEVRSARPETPSPDLFKIPADYKEVPAPMGKM